MVEILLSEEYEVVVKMEEQFYILDAIRPDWIGTHFELVDWDRVRMIDNDEK